jgi:GTP-binding protein HflX
VMDASAEDREEREAAVASVLSDIGAAQRPCVPVFNKIDCLAPGRAAALVKARPEGLLVSALTREGLDTLRTAIGPHLEMAPRSVRLRFRADDSRGITGVYGAGRVVAHAVDGDEVTIDAEIPERLLLRYREHLV